MQFIGQKPSSNLPKHSIKFYEAYCDATLRTEDGTTFKIHRIIMAQNQYFHSLFSLEANKTDILLKEIKSQTLSQILQYMYEGTLQLDEMNVVDLMIAADYMLMDEVMEQCSDFALQCMTPSNCLTLLTKAKKVERSNILRECSRYVKIHFEDIVKSFPESLGVLPFEGLMELLNDNSLNITSEDTVPTAIVNWMKVDPFNRNRHFPAVLNNNRLEETDHTPSMVENSTMISNSLCMTALQAVHPIMAQSFHINRKSRFPKYLHVGGHISETSTEIYLTFDEKLDFWKKIANVRGFPEVIEPIGKYIYLFYMSESVAQRYDMLEDQLFQLATMPTRRYFCYIVQLHGMIYAFQQNLWYPGDVHRYDPSKEMWNSIELTGLQEREICISGVVAMDGKIYVVGSIDDETLERETAMVTRLYDPTTNVWTTVASPKVLRTFCSVLAFRDHLFLVGGFNADVILRSVEEYDPTLDVWSSLPDLPHLYDRMFAKVVDETIIVFENHNPVMRWDGSAWQKVDSVIPIYRYGTVDDASVIKELVKMSRRSSFQWKRNLSVEINE